MHSFAATYGFGTPTTSHNFGPGMVGGPAKATGTKANSVGATANTSSSTSSSSTAGGVGSTFLSLLAQELQNQDPTAPVDSTAMVGQMISLSQLGQLISINQTLGAAATAPTTSTSAPSQSAAATSSSAAVAALNSGIASTLSPSTAGAATSQLPFDPNTMMPWNFGNNRAAAAAINPALNTSTMGLSGTNNNPTGGK